MSVCAQNRITNVSITKMGKVEYVMSQKGDYI